MMNKKMIIAAMILIMLVSLVFAIQGVLMHKQVDAKEDRFHTAQADYYSQAKSIRDSAETNSDLNKQLVEIQQTPSELLRLKLIGVGKILTGIYILLFGILVALIMMPVRLGKIIKNK